jgi:hypothetical protein
MRFLWGLAALAACGGGIDFTGVWTGSLANTIVCNGTTTSTIGTVRWTLAHRDDDLTITPDGNCGSFTADVTGNIAIMRAKSCSSGVQFTGGRFELRDVDRLDVSVQSTNGSTCSARSAGVLDLE